ncbi:exosome complex component MTR3 [Cyclospora cayetanensis]|uniref:Exosome complex component MTR3 n=1 Tax=Cyclospora cayetanensis TaxID=88456 RepID=A0A6P6RRF9_9EIME|nr:exosome complex component MTR3 [Cyclospora cayetanensis]
MSSGLDATSFSPSCGSSLSLLPPQERRKRKGTQPFLQGRRRDGRLPEEVRPMHVQTLSLGSASGSAFVSLGNTKVYCAIFGPRSAGRSDLQDRGFIKVDYRGSPFFNKKAEDGSGSTEQSAMLLHQALDSAVQLQRYPKSIIEVCVMVLEDDGGALPAAITCAGLALADAGVELYDLVTGASAYAFSYKDESGATRQAICLDLDASEYAAYKDYPDFTAIHFGFCPALSSICCLQCRGPLIGGTSGEQLFSLCEAVCTAIGMEVRRCLQSAFAIKEQKTILDVSQKRATAEGSASP